MPAKFGDLQKSVSDLIKNDYEFGRKFKLSTKTTGGVSFTTEGTMGAKGTAGKITLKGASPFANINVDKACVDTSGRFALDTTLKNQLAGTTFTLKAADGGSKGQDGEISAKYANDSMNAQVKVDMVSGPTVTASTAFGYQNFTLGGEVRYNTQVLDKSDSDGLEDYNVGLAYNMSDMTLSCVSSKKMSDFKVGVHQKVNSDINVGATVSGSSKAITLAGAKKLGGGGSVTGKVDSAGIASFNYITILQPGTKLISSVQVDAKDFAGDKHKFGLTLQYSP